ncbi:uncharacterized protein KQ657_004184 [Scheffersomyces spartinae]|uniref:Uncharacterized protein n=1 Tax=Scheffersomyces spartinae TaxID=45513 RepID=A0A9P7VC95_9ASCO|nr:uncharacterized protein KQ657_004184 [Scheffersomyces spartinae]KAG7195070.1 hypothetical protein KQ657_004184 [Scheffersomyces spartinae]
MQSLLHDQRVGIITPYEYAATITEVCQSNLKEVKGAFPLKNNTRAAINWLSLEEQEWRYLLSANADSSIDLWDTNSGEGINEGEKITRLIHVPRKSAHTYGVLCIQWYPRDTGMFVTSSFDHTVKVWDTNEFSPVHEFNVDQRVYSIDVLESATVAVGLDQLFIRLLDLRSAASAHTLSGHKGKTLSVKWHPLHTNVLASGGYDGEVRIWDIRRSKSCLCRLDMLKTADGDDITEFNYVKHIRIPSVKAHLGPVNGLTWDSSGTLLYSAGNDDKVRVWDMTLPSPPPTNLLINFGPLTRNKYPQTIPLLLNHRHESNSPMLFFPSDNGDVYGFRAADGKLICRLHRSSSTKFTAQQDRTTAMVRGSPFLSKYIHGTANGALVMWAPMFDLPTATQVFGDLVHDDDEEYELISTVEAEQKRLCLRQEAKRKGIELG